jgi:hypothetical protein
MSLPVVIEPAVGTANGTNQLFETNVPYKPGSVVMFLNGQAKRQDHDDGWTELGGKKVHLKVAPRTQDVVFFYYIPI